MSAVDSYIVYKIIQALTTPFEETDAFKLGLIDKDGKRLKKASSPEEKKAMTHFDKLIFNLKRILAKFGLTSKFSTFAAALFLIREDTTKYTDEEAAKYINEHSDYLNEEIVNATGSNVAGTGDSGVHWVKHPYKVGTPGDKRKKGRYINGVAYLKRMAKEVNRPK